MAVPLSSLKEKLAAKKRRTDAVQTPPRASAQPRQQAKPAEPALPDSPEIEKALLGAILQSPEQGFSEFDHLGKKEFFANAIYREIFETAHQFWNEKKQLDLIAFTAHLSDTGKLTKLGGPAAITEIFVSHAPASMIGYYVDELREKYVRRQIMLRSFSLAGKAKEGDVLALISDMARSVEDLRQVSTGLNGSGPQKITPYMEADTHRDPDCLVGNRWIVRGGSTLWCGSPGIGKSSLIMQLVLYWAKGESIFGLRPTRPLRSLIIQAENDFLDVSEQIQGIAAALEKVDQFNVADLAEKIWIAQCSGMTGWKFLAYLEMVLGTYKTDLLWIDPLFAYAGCDLMNAKDTGLFLREGLFPLAAKHGVSIQVAHHLGKHIRDPQTKEQLSDADMQFLGFGTSEIQNAFRAVNILIPERESNLFKLSFSKRGERAKAKHPDGEFARNIYLKHSSEGICWLQVDPVDIENKRSEKGQFQNRFTAKDILEEMSVVGGIKTTKLQKLLADERGMSKATFYRLFDELKHDRKVKITDAGWLRTGKAEVANHETPRDQKENTNENQPF